MGLFDFGNKKRISELEKENIRLRYERDYAVGLNKEKDNFVKSLAGRLLKKGDPEGGRLLADYKKYKNSQKK